jgi:SAM-dependent methyltransferase
VIACKPPPGHDQLPAFDGGWLVDGQRMSHLTYAGTSGVNWSDELEQLHEEASRDHFMDVWTRDAILDAVAPVVAPATIADLGCSTGYLLEDLRARYPDAELIGVDLVAAGLRKANELVPTAYLMQADVCDLPLADASVDMVTSANLLEHVPDDTRALAEVARILKPGGRAAIVVPAGPGTYDYYDRYLGHERRYGRGELARKARSAGLEVVEDRFLASLLFPAFWLVKQRNRRRFADLEGDALRERVAADIGRTQASRVGAGVSGLERRLGLRLPFGIRNIVAARRPPAPKTR